MQSSVVRSHWIRLAVAFSGSVIVGFFVGIVAAPFYLMTFPPLGFWPARELFAETSPDGRYRIEGSVAEDFPPNEWLDPKGTLRLELLDQTGVSLDQFWVGLYEADDFKRPTITWQPDGKVLVRDMDETGHDLSATLDVHRRSRKQF